MLYKNTTNFSFNAFLNESRCNSSSGSCSPVQTCPGTVVHLAYISVIWVIGVLGNILLLYVDYKEWKKSKTPDKLLILNLAITNVAALLVSLPLHAVLVANYQDYLKCAGSLFQYRSARFFLICLFNFVSLGTLLVIGIDRYQALIKFAHQRTLDLKRSIFAICLVWLCSITVVVVFIVTWPNQCTDFYSSRLEDRNTDNYYPMRITIISIWITVCCTVTGRSLLMAASRIRKQQQKIKTMFGPVQAAAQISFTKGVIGLLLCYVVLWIPYG
ncbi:neuropeptide receptor 15-like, partial [Actinia tenebrosa]